ncbi:MAG TPA: hypothetical protein VHF23_09755 [Gaiellaceae bacterium]|nr:hypothetical protein [Gaiellaceae bacterium]
MLLHNLLLSMNRLYAGRHCRRCGEPVAPGDRFGVSEGVCPGCRR